MYQNALRTSTKQGCNIAKIAVNVREDTKDEIELLMDGAPTASKVIETDLQLKVSSWQARRMLIRITDMRLSSPHSRVFL